MAKISRRAFLRGSLAAAAVPCFGTYVYARAVEATWLDIASVDMPLRRLPDAFAGFTIAQISDLHFGRNVRPEFIDTVVDRVLELNADAIVITGDFVSRVTHGEPDMIVHALSRLHAREGVYAILGNHDWWENASLVTESLRQAEINLLSNANMCWRRGGQTLHLAGVDDVWCGKNDLDEALRGIPGAAAAIALVHEPDYADVVARDKRVILQLSGHSHGGQVRLPMLGPISLPEWGKKYIAGQYEIDDLTLYTNRGIGTVVWPVRLGSRPEITLFTLKPRL